MNNSMLSKRKNRGFILTTELVLVATIMVVGLIAGLVTVRDSVTAEMEDVAEAIGHFDQTYAFNGIVNGEKTATVAGSAFGDAPDTLAGDDVVFTFVAPSTEEGDGATPDSAGAESASVAGIITAP